MTIHIHLIDRGIRNDLQPPDEHLEENYTLHRAWTTELLSAEGYERTECEVMVGPAGQCSKHYAAIYSDGNSFVVTWDGMFHVTDVAKVHGWMSKENFLQWRRNR